MSRFRVPPDATPRARDDASRIPNAQSADLASARYFTVIAWGREDRALETVPFLGAVDAVHRFAIDRLRSLPGCVRVSIAGNPSVTPAR